MSDILYAPQPQDLLILADKLVRAPDVQTYLAETTDFFEQTTLHGYLSKLCAERGYVREQIIKRAGLDRTYGHQIFRGVRRPSRDKILLLAFAMALSTDEAQALLRLARKPMLHPGDRRDAVVLYCLTREIDLVRAQEELNRLGLTPLET